MRTPPAPILLTRELAATGERPDLLSRRAARGELVRLCRGAYARTEDLRLLTSGQRHLLSVLAVTLTGMLGDGAVLARESAALLHGIPLIGPIPERVQLVRPGRSGGRSTHGLRTLRAPEDYETTRLDGVLVSTPAQTLIDLGRRRSLSSTLAGLDAVLRAGTVHREQLTELAQSHPSAHGNARLRYAIDLADPLAESPGESLSRAVMVQRRLPPPSLQVEVHDRTGRLLGRVDFMWPELGVIGEFDGAIKYTRALTGRSVDQIVLEERRREQAIERATGMRVTRWTWKDALGEAGMLRALADVGVLPRR